MPLPFGIHWFRRDLRVAGNPALEWNRSQNQGRTLGIFFFDSQFLTREDFSHHRFGFFLKTLKCLKEELKQFGGDLLVLDRRPLDGFEFLFSHLKVAPSSVSFNRDYEPFARERDFQVTRVLDERGILVHTERDHLLIEPQELGKDSRKGRRKLIVKPSFYQGYTPFFKKWQKQIQEDEFWSRIQDQDDAISSLEKLKRGKAISLFKLKWSEVLSQIVRSQDSLEIFIEKNRPYLKITLPEAGSINAFDAVQGFKKRINHYQKQRDFPAVKGTSQLSIYFKNGSMTPALALKILEVKSCPKNPAQLQYLKEIVWREFYYHILYHQPSVETEAFLPKYRKLAWENNEKWFEAWKEGKTGFPMVDAAMRELKTTGWMHNRSRMIVASFLTKDLLIDWRWGEKYFMNQLLDGDLAPNNGGWQWAASTGCDPQPYFRVFNPVLQSWKFDPLGDYIKKYIPELRHLSVREIHEPGKKYIDPIIDHAVQKPKAIALYKKLK